MIKEYVIFLAVLVFMALVPFSQGGHYVCDKEDDSLNRANLDYEGDCSSADPHTLRNENIQTIVVAATINGVITALDAETGKLLWTFEDDPLLAGTLSTAGPIDIGGTSLKLMPTLDGRLFSYAQQSNLIEPLPITTEALLESTVRLGRDAVAGGKTVSTVGIDVVTGKVKYKCAPDACANSANSEYSPHPILLVKRISNSIRAMDALIGTERWNLSTAELDLSLAGLEILEENTRYRKILLHPPDGIITSRGRDATEDWTTRINGHIVGVWSINGNSIEEISLFDPANIYTTHYEVDHRLSKNMQAQSSLFYVGTTDGYPFIIQSPKSKYNLKKKMSEIEYSSLKEVTCQRLCSANSATRELAYEVEDTALLVVLREAFGKSHIKAIEDKSDGTTKDALKIVSYDDNSEYETCSGIRSGVALIGVENLRSTSMIKEGDYGYLVLDTQTCRPRSISPIISSNLIQKFAFNLKSIIGILFSGIVGAYFGWRQFRSRRKLRAIESTSSEENQSTEHSLSIESHSTSELMAVAKINGQECFKSLNEDISETPKRSPLATVSQLELAGYSPIQRSKHPKNDVNSVNIDHRRNEENTEDEKRKQMLRARTISRSSLEGFVSRFSSDYEVDKVIGHGGFGIVFKATCLADSKVYAVKRIAVAYNERARERVLREARALANLDHPGIIRYYCTWEEHPPKGYQGREDELLEGKIKSEKLKKIHGIGKKRKNKEMQATEESSLAKSFEMPAIVGHTGEESWSTSQKPQQINAKRTTSESKRGLAGLSLSPVLVENADEEWESKSRTSNKSIDSSTESSESNASSDENEKNFEYQPSSSGIMFVNDQEEKSNIDDDDLKIDIKNRAIIVETENQELELRELDEHGDCIYLYIVMQLCAERTLEDWIRKNKSPETRCLKIMKQWIRQLADALDYIHDKGYIHRDFKPGNVFFSLESKPNREVLKIGDLGLATKANGATKKAINSVHSDAKHTKNVGTRSYMSPEQLSGKGYTNKVDIFALGLVATELIIPFSTVTERVVTFNAMQTGSYPTILDEYPDAKDFLTMITEFDPAKRPSAAEILDHPFLQ